MHPRTPHRIAALAACIALFIGCGGNGKGTENESTVTPTAVPTTPHASPSSTTAPTAFPTPPPSPTASGLSTATPQTASTPTPTLAGTPAPTGRACDITNPCLAGRFCDLPPGVCATALDQGICVDVPGLCRDPYAPVCGCDGLTYGNDCLRRGAKVQKSHDGACATVECEEDCDCYERRTFALPCPLECATCDNYWTCTEGRCFEHCGPVPGEVCPARCTSNADCAEDDSCQKPAGQCDAGGACVPRPQGCPRILDPVCGCDGHTHSNNCERERAGVALAHTGACLPP